MELGKRIQRERRLRSWSQGELGEKVGVTAKSVSNWESGRHDPRSAVPLLEEVFGVSLSEDDPAEVRDRVESAIAASELVPWRQDAVRSVYRKNLEAQRDERGKGAS